MAALPEPLPTIVRPFLEDLRTTLRDELVTAALYGSAVAGDFEPEASDLDVLVVTASPMDELPIEAFEGLIARLAAREPDWADRLDVALIDRRTLAALGSGGSLLSISHDEPLRRWDDASEWLETWYLVRTADMPLVGPPPRELMPEIPTSAFIDAVVAGVDGLAARLSRDPRSGPRAYLVLTLGRMLRSLETSTTCSKLEGAAWIAEHHPASRSLVEDCLAVWRSRGRRELAASQAALPALVASLVGEVHVRRGEMDVRRGEIDAPG